MAISSRTSATVEWSGDVGPEESASSERSGTSGSSRLTLVASGAAMARRPPLTAEKCLRRVLISLMGAPEASSAWWKALVSSRVICGSRGRSNMAEPPPEMRKKMSVSFFAFLQQGQRGAGGGKGIFIGQRMAALKVADAPVAVLGKLVGAADAAQALAALHAIEQGFKHGAGGLAERDDKDALVAGEVDGGGAAAVGQKAVERVALEAQAAVEGGGDVAGLEGAGKDFGGGGVQGVESGIAGRGHEQLLLEPAGERGLHRCQVTGKKVIGAGKEHETFGFGSGGGHLRQIERRARTGRDRR